MSGFTETKSQTSDLGVRLSKNVGSLSSLGRPRKPKSTSKASLFFGVGVLEPTTINFEKLAKFKGSEKKWNDVAFRDRVDLIRAALTPTHHLIDPNSGYMKHWDIMIISALIYTALMTPYEVGFLETKLDALFVVNRIIDVIFVKDMIMNFFVKLTVRTKTSTLWLRDQKKIVKHYLKGWFVIDFISILPFDIIGFVYDDPAIQKMKVIRIIRILRLLKIARVLRASRIVKRWQNHTSMTYSQQGLIKFAIMLLLASHWMSCVWGGTGRLLGINLVCDENDVTKYELKEDVGGHSWITLHGWGPDTPCSATDVYLASLHFSVMTITSIGYGDITPTRKVEYIIGILCQLGGGLTWAYVIGSICGIIANQNPIKVEFENSMDALNRMLVEQQVEQQLRYDLREYLREQQHHNYLERARSIADTFSPQLQGRLLQETVMGAAINKVWYFRNCEEIFRVKLSHAFRAQQFSKGDQVGGQRLLCIVQRGSIAWNGRVLLPGDFWGEDMIVSSPLLKNMFPNEALAMHYAEVLQLTQESLENLLTESQYSRQSIRKAALIIAFRTAVRMFAGMALEGKQSLLPSSPSSKTGKEVSPENKQSHATMQMVRGIFEEARQIKTKGYQRVWAQAQGNSLQMENHVRPPVPPEGDIATLQEIVQGAEARPAPLLADSPMAKAMSTEPWVKALLASVESLKTEISFVHTEISSVRTDQSRILEKLRTKESFKETQLVPGQIPDPLSEAEALMQK